MFIALSGRALGIAALVALAGCSGASTTFIVPAQTPTQTQSAFSHLSTTMSLAARPAYTHDYSTRGALLFEADYSEWAVNVYKIRQFANNPKPIATISEDISYPDGIAVSQGVLYVEEVEGAIVMFPLGQTTPSGQITNGLNEPQGISIDPAGTTLYVSNFGNGTVSEYPLPNPSSPSQIVSGMMRPTGTALDKHNNLFVADECSTQVWEIKAGTTTATPLNLVGLSAPVGVGIDKSGKLWVSDDGGNDDVAVYAAGSTIASHLIKGIWELPYAITVDTRGTVFVTNLSTTEAKIVAFPHGSYEPSANLTNNVVQPEAVGTNRSLY